MDRIGGRRGFLPGIFGKVRRTVSKTASSGLNPGPREEFLAFMPARFRNEFLAMAGEFVGTFLFLFFAFAGTQVANTPSSGSGSTTIPQGPNPSQLLYIALSFGFSLAVNAWIFFRVTGGLFNPAVTLGLCLIGAVPFSRGLLVFIAQLLGAMAVSGVMRALYPGPLAVSTTLGGGASVVQGLFIEMFLTAQLVFTIFMLAAEKHKSTFLAPVGIGLSLFIAELGGVYYTGGSLNPARSFGPCVANLSFPSEHWIYWVGPILGALVASGFFWFIKAAEYETVNPGQDFDDLEASAFDPEKDLNRPVVQATHSTEPVLSKLSGTNEENEGQSRMNRLLSGDQPKARPSQYQTEQYDTAQYARHPQSTDRYDTPQYVRRSQAADQYDSAQVTRQPQGTDQYGRPVSMGSMGSNTLREQSVGRSGKRRPSSQNYDQSGRPRSGHRHEIIGGPTPNTRA